MDFSDLILYKNIFLLISEHSAILFKWSLYNAVFWNCDQNSIDSTLF